MVRGKRIAQSKEKIIRWYQKTTIFIKKRPLGSVALVFALLFLLLFIGQVLRSQGEEKKAEPSLKAVRVYSIGDAPRATFQAKVEKEGIVKIMSQTAGIVQYIAVTEGSEIGQGQQLLSLSSNYQGGNVSTIQRQIAQEQYQNVLDTYDKQKDGIAKQKDIANTTDENADKMRGISQKANDDTNSQIDNANEQIDTLKDTIDALAGVPGQEQQIEQLKAQVQQAESGILQLRSTQRNLEYQGDEKNPPMKLSNLQKDLTIQQLDVQERALQMHREVSRLQVSLAYVNESLMAPASPFAGKVERIYVKPGQSVTPGTVLAVISASEIKATAVLHVPESIARIISLGEPSELIIEGAKVAATPYHVSTLATDGSLFAVFYDIPAGTQKGLSDGDYISVQVPVDTAKTTSADPFVPIDAIYQTQDSAFVLIIKNNKAEMRTVKLGKVFGSTVQILSGLGFGDQVILDRHVIGGDRVKVY